MPEKREGRDPIVPFFCAIRGTAVKKPGFFGGDVGGEGKSHGGVTG